MNPTESQTCYYIPTGFAETQCQRMQLAMRITSATAATGPCSTPLCSGRCPGPALSLLPLPLSPLLLPLHGITDVVAIIIIIAIVIFVI